MLLYCYTINSIAIDIIDHPSLTKLNKEKVQLYKPVQKVQKIPKYSANQNNAFIQTKFCSKSRNLAPIPPKSSIYNFERKSSNVKNDDANVEIFHKIVLCDYENNEIQNEINSVIKKSFILPKPFIAKHFIENYIIFIINKNANNNKKKEFTFLNSCIKKHLINLEFFSIFKKSKRILL